MSRSVLVLLLLCLSCAFAACDGAPESPDSAQVAAAPEATTEVSPEASVPASSAGIQQRHESTERYEYRVRWPDELARDAGIEAAMRAIADDRLQEFIEAAGSAPADSGRWTLELDFSACAGTAELRCIAADGSVFTGGAHPLPIIERLLYSSTRSTALRPDQLFTDADAALRAISARASEMLLTQRIAQAAVSGAPADAAARASMRGEIASGAEPSPANYRLAEPVVSGSGRINALKFLFAPYQVASYAEGTLVAEVPATVFAQWLRPEFAGEFVTR